MISFVEWDYDMAKFLIENGADVNARDEYGNTPLLEAAYSGVWGTCKLKYGRFFFL